MNKKTSKIIKKSKKIKKPKRAVNKSNIKSTKDKSVKQNVNVNVSSGGGSAPHPFLSASKSSRGEDVLLQKLTDLLAVNKSNIPTPKRVMVESSINTNPMTNEMATNTIPIINASPTTDEIGTNTFNEMIDSSTQIDNKFNNLFEPSENIKVERKPNIDNTSLLDNVLTVQNTPARNSVNDGRGFTMYKPIENKSVQNSPINISQYKIPTREEIRSLRVPIDYTQISPYNEGAIVPISDAKSEQPKVQPKEVEKVQPKEVEQKQNKTRNIDNLIPSLWAKKYNLKSDITRSEYKELKSYMIRYGEANTAERTKITKQMTKDFFPKIQNKPLTKVKQMVENIENKMIS